MMKLSDLSFLLTSLLILLLLSACGNPRKGALSPESRTELDEYAEAYISIEKKYLKLAEKTADLLQEAAATPTEAAAMELIRKFASDNDLAITAIAKDFDGWQKHANHDDQMEFVATLVTQPYGQTLRKLEPAFRKRIAYNKAWVREFDRFMQQLYVHR